MPVAMPFDIAADLDTPVSAYLKLRPFRPRFLLESVEQGDAARSLLVHRLRRLLRSAARRQRTCGRRRVAPAAGERRGADCRSARGARTGAAASTGIRAVPAGRRAGRIRRATTWRASFETPAGAVGTTAVSAPDACYVAPRSTAGFRPPDPRRHAPARRRRARARSPEAGSHRCARAVHCRMAAGSNCSGPRAKA